MYDSLWSCTVPLLLLACGIMPGYLNSGPGNITVETKDGEAMVYWDPPAGAPSVARYEVQVKRYSSDLAANWTTVPGCAWTQATCCVLSDVMSEPLARYFVRVRMVSNYSTSQWTRRKRLSLADSELLPPALSLTATSSSVKVKVHTKPILKRIFPFGLLYTIYLRETGPHNQTAEVVQVLWEGAGREDEVLFSFLRWGQEYCISGQVEALAALPTSGISPELCVLLPRPGWHRQLVLAFSALTVLVIAGPLTLLIRHMLKQPEKMPGTLRPSLSAWRPLSLAEAPVEMVTDRGWLLLSRRPVEKPVLTEEEKSKEESRRSRDSGMEETQPPSDTEGASHPWPQDDSGCGSLDSGSSGRGGFEGLHLLDRRSDDNRHSEDRGVGLEGPVQAGGAGPRLLDSVVVADGYRHQAPPSVEAAASEQDEDGAAPQADEDCGALVRAGLGAGLTQDPSSLMTWLESGGPDGRPRPSAPGTGTPALKDVELMFG
ncbi:hypothetical protein AGOR_G00031620 [Albula goreensis]|uniref:Fibronectin type-III domain-containing protein n=1 Tax=Albula goreensis TaxID=1534307 RepID=A0A8T3E9W4_9TELE|nr:hypothetical protein AGOR_G00031620 [Albula goreensis]